MPRQRRKLTEAEVSELLVAQGQAPEAGSAIRCQAVRLYGEGYAVETIKDVCRCSRQAVMVWNRKYHGGGVAALMDGRVGGNRAYLSREQIEELRKKIHQYEPRKLFAADAYEGDGRFWTVLTLALLVEREYGVRYQQMCSYRTLFEKCGFSYQRPGQHYHSRNEEKVLAFEEELEKNSATSPRVLLRQ